uniref:Uncharacterized protein n=1 Tax=Arundo donax TaxID=35708 RepID=A0A0A9FQE0_ARUDO
MFLFSFAHVILVGLHVMEDICSHYLISMPHHFTFPACLFFSPQMSSMTD